MFMVTQVLDDLWPEAEVVGPLEVEGEEKGPSSKPENSVSKVVGEQVEQLPKMPTEKQAEGPVEGLLGESIEGPTGGQAEVQIQERAKTQEQARADGNDKEEVI